MLRLVFAELSPRRSRDQVLGAPEDELGVRGDLLQGLRNGIEPPLPASPGGLP